MRFGEHIRARRLSLGMTQAELAALTNVSRPQICNIENDVTMASMNTLYEIADALDCELVIELRPIQREIKPAPAVAE